MLSLATSRLLGYVIGAFVVLGGIWFIYDWGYDSGVEKTTKSYERAIQKERIRIQTANQAALEEAYEKETELRDLLDERSARISQLLDQANRDPNAGRTCLGIDSVLRINRIGGTSKSSETSD